MLVLVRVAAAEDPAEEGGYAVGNAETKIIAVAKKRVGLSSRVSTAFVLSEGELTSWRLNMTPMAAVRRKKELTMFGRA